MQNWQPFSSRTTYSTATCLVAALLIVATCGCHLRLDQWPPGTIGNQRARAAVHDPFPSNELGPPIMGGRPLGFDQPPAQTRSLQDVISNPYSRRRGGVAPPQYGF